MNEHEEQLYKIEITLESAEKAIALADALQRLHNNSDFKMVILEDYFRNEASRAVMIRADSSMQTEEKQKGVNNIITAIGGLYQYFGKVYRLGDSALRAIDENKATREEILAEQLQANELVQ